MLLSVMLEIIWHQQIICPIFNVLGQDVNNPHYKASDGQHMKRWSWGSDGSKYDAYMLGLRGFVIIKIFQCE